MLRTRILTVAVLLPSFLLLLFFSSFAVWSLSLLPVVAAAAFEWAKLGWWRGNAAFVYAVAQAALCVLLLTFTDNGERLPEFFLIILALSALFWVGLVFPWLRFKWQTRSVALHGMLGIVMVVPLWISLVLLKGNPVLMLAAMAIVWIADSAAYFAGHQWGRRKLAPGISPGKTWEGVYGALIAVGMYATAAAGAWPAGNWMHLVAVVFLSLFLAVLGILGDLFESLAKRQAGVKDSGKLLPGHGGVLDRIDALLPSMPVAALAYWFFIR